MREVSHHPVDVMVIRLEQLNIPADRLIDGIELPSDFKINGRYRIDWDHYIDLVDRFVDLTSPDELYRIGELTFKTPSLKPAISIMRWLMNAELIYYMIDRWLGHSIINNVDSKLEKLPDGRLKQSLWLQDGYRPSANFFKIAHGNLKIGPLALGQRAAFVEAVEISDRHGVYVIDLPPSLTLWSRLRRSLWLLFGPRNAIEALAEQQKEVENSYKELESQRKLIVESSKIMQLGGLAASAKLAGGVAHEINSPLTTLSIRNQLLKKLVEKNEPSSKVLKAIEQQDASIDRIAKIVRSLLIVTGENHDEPLKEVSLREVSRNVINIHTARLSNAGIELQIQIPEDETQWPCRPKAIASVLHNLILNAFDAVEGQETKKVTFTLEPGPNLVKIRIKDSGAGFSQEARERVFEPFFTTKEVGRGTGLGLSISRAIIEDHGGKIWFEEHPDGSEAIFTLPRTQPRSNKLDA